MAAFVSQVMSMHLMNGLILQGTNIAEFKLEPDTELRFEVDDENVQLEVQLLCCFAFPEFSPFTTLSCSLLKTFLVFQLSDGHAEIFGTELTKGKKYMFYPGAKLAAYSWQGCVITISFQIVSVARITNL